MDSLVAKYSRPKYEQNEPQDNDVMQELNDDPWANLSLKFAMPPIAQVGLRTERRLLSIDWWECNTNAYHALAISLAASCD